MSDTSAEQAAREYAGGTMEPLEFADMAAAFRSGAKWQRGRPVTEAEVEAALNAVNAIGDPACRIDRYEIRAALEAARRVGDGG